MLFATYIPTVVSFFFSSSIPTPDAKDIIAYTNRASNRQHFAPLSVPASMKSHTGYEDPWIGFASYKPKSRLMELPAELRNRIFAEAATIVSPKGEIVILDFKKLGIYHSRITALLKVNHQMRQEVTGLFYGDNVFRIISYVAREQATDPSKLTINQMCEELVYMGSGSVAGVTAVPARLYIAGSESPQLYYIPLPPRHIRPMILHLRIHPEVSLFDQGSQLERADSHANGYMERWRVLRGQKSDNRRLIWEVNNDDWLYPLRNLNGFGFGKLETLHAELVMELDSPRQWMEAVAMIQALDPRAKRVTVSSKKVGKTFIW